jgi:cytochrome c-type biogenesis protein CcsB
MEQITFGAAFFFYTAAMALFFGYVGTRREILARVASGAMLLGVVSHLASLINRTLVALNFPGHGFYVPWSNWFESFSFLAFVIAFIFLVIEWRKRLPILGAFVTPLIFGCMMAAFHSPFGTRIPPLSPGLQSYWMAFHIPVMFIAYAAFALAFAVGLAYLVQERQLKSRHPSALAFRLPPLEELDDLIYRIILWAVPVLAIGLFLGAEWAFEVWGRYWGWDAKETWALITLLTYVLYLVMRLVVGWRGRKAAYLSLAGFAVVLFTYIGVNYLSSLHSFFPGS